MTQGFDDRVYVGGPIRFFSDEELAACRRVARRFATRIADKQVFDGVVKDDSLRFADALDYEARVRLRSS